MTRPVVIVSAERWARDIIDALRFVIGKEPRAAAIARIEPIVARAIAAARHDEATHALNIMAGDNDELKWRVRQHRKHARRPLRIHASTVKAPVRGRRKS